MSSVTANPLTDPEEARLAAGAPPPESRGRGVWSDVRHAAKLLKQYFGADPVIGVALLIAKLGLGAAASYVTMMIQLKMADATSALAEQQGHLIPQLLIVATALFAGMIVAGVVADWVGYVLRMRARTVLSDRLLGRWLTDNRFYHLEQRANLDHPEQRIQEDIFVFVETALMLLPGMIISMFPLFLYSGKLWELSPQITMGLGGQQFVIHGYLVFVTIGFTLVWTLVTHLMGSSLTRAEITRQGLEAQFRQEMGAVRENSEAVAFQNGAALETVRISRTFDLIKENWKHYTNANLRVTFATNVPTLLFIMGPMALCAPFVIRGQMRVGDIAFVGAALGAVYMAVGVFIQSYHSLAILRSAVSRLRYFDELLVTPPPVGDIGFSRTGRKAFSTDGLVLSFPDGRQMVELGEISIAPGDRVLIKGPSGGGKSTFLRTLAGLWSFGRGSVQAPENVGIYFLPQRSYMPDGTLASLISYPRDARQVPDETYVMLLERLGLEGLTPRLHEYASWRKMLSPGEQQRIAAARAIVNAPEFLFVDEATSALDLRSEANFYSLLSEKLPDAAIISIAHRPTVEQFHDRIIEFVDHKAVERAGDRPVKPVG